MTWLQRYRFRHYQQNAIWVWPAAAIVGAVISARLLHWLEDALGWEAAINPETARSVLGALAGAVIGNAIERSSTREDALEITVQLRNGERRAWHDVRAAILGQPRRALQDFRLVARRRLGC